MPQQETAISLLGGQAMGSETDYRSALPVNMTAIIGDVLSAKGYMHQISGLTQYGTGSGVDRRGVWNERHQMHYRVSGADFISVDADGTTTVLGTISGAVDNTVSMPYSFNTQAIIANGKYYLYDDVGGFRQVLDIDVGAPIDACWINGVYFFTDGENLYHTQFSDEESIEAIRFATAEFSPDPTLGVERTSDNRVIVFNRYSTEFFNAIQANIEAPATFGFARVQNRFLKSGIVGTHCKAEMDGVFLIMGGRKEEAVSIHALTAGGTEKIATREIDKVIGQYNEDELSKSVLEVRVEDAYSYLIVHLPNETLMFNSTLSKTAGLDKAWTILKSDVYTEQNTVARDYRAKFTIFEPRLGRWVCGDKEDGTLGIIDETVSTHYGELIECVMHTPYTALEKMSIDEIDIENVAGFTNTDDATVAISLSYDGVTHGQEYWAKYGSPSKYSKRFIARRLGYVRDWVTFKFRIASRSRVAFSIFKLKFG